MDEWPPSDFRIMSCGALSQEDAVQSMAIADDHDKFTHLEVRHSITIMPRLHVWLSCGYLQWSQPAKKYETCMSYHWRFCVRERESYRECSVDVLMWISVRTVSGRAVLVQARFCPWG